MQRQKEAILERIQKFTGRLYLEIGGKFLYDPHAARVLPGFLADSKKQIFSSLMEQAEIIFCMNANDIIRDRQLLSNKKSYLKVCLEMIENINRVLGTYPKVAINRVKESDL
ncbi:MAG: DUF1846 family protein [Candidatus Peribacteria bacterium]|nr:MAG: DUF1846 family protein [Candidatus Peribacteria bacterium]